MLFSTAEIEVLRLAGRLKAIPLDLGGFDTGLFSPAGIDGLCLYKLLYPTRNGRYLRLTPAGWELLYGLGYPYPKDACYITDPQKLRRRDEAAKLLFTCYRAGMDAFADTPGQLSQPPVYLSSAAARRNTAVTGAKVWAGCRMAGIVRLGQTAYMLHFMDGQGLLFQSEMSLFHKLTAGHCEQTAAVYTADSYLAAANGMLNEPSLPVNQKRANGWYSFAGAAQSLLMPLHLLECSDAGACQLTLMGLPDYREKLALLEDYRQPPDHDPDCDAFSASLGQPLLVAIDMDVKRLERAARRADKEGRRLMLLILESQSAALTLLLSSMGLAGSADFYALPEALFTEHFGLRLYEPPGTPYRTQEGGYLDAAALGSHCKAGKKARTPN